MSNALTDGESSPTEPQGEEAGVHDDTQGAGAQSVAEEANADKDLGPNSIHVRFAGITAVGLIREHNEDNLVNANLTTGKLYPRAETCTDAIGARGYVFAVCDGMGGAAAGEVASQMAVDMIFNALREGEPPADRDQLAQKLVLAVEQAGKVIYETAQSDQSRRGMGTTVTAAVLLDKILFLAQVGDSRAYLLRRGEVKQLTKDQSLVSQLVEAGHLTEAEAESFEHSNIILQALGTAQTVQVDLTFIELRQNDRVMLCSDGLSGMVETSVLHDTLREYEEPKLCCEKLIEYANAGGGHDNITVIVIDFSGESLRPAAEGETFGYMQYPLPLPPQAAEPEKKVVEKAVAVASKPVKVERPRAIRESPKRSSSHLWIVAGVTALTAAAAAVVVVKPKSKSEASKPVATHQLKPAANPPKDREQGKKTDDVLSPERANAPVAVRVFTEVENARLIVNGEPRGPISAGETRIIELAPGAYRFEALSGNSIAATTVVTVRPETPLEVALNLPSGTADSTKGRLDAVLPPAQRLAEKGQGDLESSRAVAARKKSAIAAQGSHRTRTAAESSTEVSASADTKDKLPVNKANAETAPVIAKSAAEIPPDKQAPPKTEEVKIKPVVTEPPPAPSQTPAKAPAKGSEIPENPFSE